MARRTPPWWLVAAAVTFVAYFVLLVYCDVVRPEPHGFVAEFAHGAMVLSAVMPDSPAARADLRVGDIIATGEGRAIRSAFDWALVENNLRLAKPIDLTIQRGRDTLSRRLLLVGATWRYWTTAPGMVMAGVLLVQTFTLFLALLIVLKRPDDRLAWLGAWVLATAAVFTIVPPYRIAAVWRGLPSALAALMWVPYLSSLAAAAVLFTFFAHFPRRYIRSARLAIVAWLPMVVVLIVQTRGAEWGTDQAAPAPAGALSGPLALTATAGYLIVGLLILVRNYRRLDDVNQRRRAKVVVIGAVAGLVPGVLLVGLYRILSDTEIAASIFASRVMSVATLSLLLFPSAFAYALLRHRLFDLPLIIRQGVRYAIARGVLVSVVPLLALLLVGDVWARRHEPLDRILQSRASIYVGVAVLAAAAHTQRRRLLLALDRQFFREHYNAQQLLRQVVEDIHHVGEFGQVAPRVVAHIEAALHPESVALLIRIPSDVQYRPLVAHPVGLAPSPLPLESPAMGWLRLRGVALDVSEMGQNQLPDRELERLRQSHIELLVPIALNPDHTEALLTLGGKRSEEPYSDEDRDLLAIIAMNVALLLKRPAVSVQHAPATSTECPRCGLCDDADAVACRRDEARLEQVALPRLLALRYRLDRRVGQGGFGTVYEAFDTALDRRVAIKMMRDGVCGRGEVATRFHREARLAAGLVHPNVVTIYDFGIVASARAFLVMEFLDGITLREELLRTSGVSPARAVAIMRDVCAAIEQAHHRQLVHRDLKPENIVLVKHGQKEVAKVLDFGVATMLTDAPDALAHTGFLVGTLRYMAPAQLCGETADTGSDIWALGVMAYELLTGVHPFAHITFEPFSGTPYDHAKALAKPLGNAPPPWKGFFESALALDSGRRPDTASRFLAEFEAALATART